MRRGWKKNRNNKGQHNCDDDFRKRSKRAGKAAKRTAMETVEGERNGKHTRGKLQKKGKKNDAPIKANKRFSDSKMCRHCQQNDKGRVVQCRSYKRKRYCIQCLKTWYPKMTEDEVAKECPGCFKVCNCKACLCLDGPIKRLKNNVDLTLSEDEVKRHLKFTIQKILPFLKQSDEEQMTERRIEARTLGIALCDLEVEDANCPKDDRMFCYNCSTSIFVYHRSCPDCSYDLCLICCLELRDDHLRGGEKEVVNRGFGYLHGEKGTTDNVHQQWRQISSRNKVSNEVIDESSGCDKVPLEVPAGKSEELVMLEPQGKANRDGSIGCERCCGTLKLKCLFPVEEVTCLLNQAKAIAERYELDLVTAPADRCACFDPRGDLEHFQFHWARAEHVIVSNLLETASGLSWDPMVMWRAFYQEKKHEKHDSRLDWSEVSKDASMSVFCMFITANMWGK